MFSFQTAPDFVAIKIAPSVYQYTFPVHHAVRNVRPFSWFLSEDLIMGIS